MNLQIKKYLPNLIQRGLNRIGLQKHYQPSVGSVIIGDFNRVIPFSRHYGYDRGGPIDRYYIENFLREEAQNISGRILEIGDNHYTKLYGGDRITKSDILHVDATNPSSTIIGDISHAPQIPDETFDCIILTQTLQYIYDCKAALSTCNRILKPGGVLLVTVPGIAPYNYDEWPFIWSFTHTVIGKLIEDSFPKAETTINTYGNVYVASAFLYGMGLKEIAKNKLDFNDPHYQLVIAAKVVKK